MALASPPAACLLDVSSNAQLIRNSNALPAVTRLSAARNRDEADKLQRLGVECRRGLAAQPSIAGVDQTDRKVGYRVLPVVEGVFDLRLVLEREICNVQ